LLKYCLKTECTVINEFPSWCSFDLSEGGPEPGLRKFEDSKETLTVIACGGDGTVCWVLSVLDKLKWSPYPPIAVLPLGTGNDMARVLLWGKGYEGEDLHSFLHKVQNSAAMQFDRWKIHAKFLDNEQIQSFRHTFQESKETHTHTNNDDDDDDDDDTVPTIMSGDSVSLSPALISTSNGSTPPVSPQSFNAEWNTGKNTPPATILVTDSTSSTPTSTPSGSKKKKKKQLSEVGTVPTTRQSHEFEGASPPSGNPTNINTSPVQSTPDSSMSGNSLRSPLSRSVHTIPETKSLYMKKSSSSDQEIPQIDISTPTSTPTFSPIVSSSSSSSVPSSSKGKKKHGRKKKSQHFSC